MSKLHIIFCGTPAFACPSLAALSEDDDFNVSCVMTQPDKPAGRGRKIAQPPVKQLAVKLGIPVFQPKNINTAFEEGELPAHPFPDVLVTVAYGQILSIKLLSWPSIVPVNLHASLLPFHRGASPIQHTILAGDRETGITIQRMTAKVDSGPILVQEKVPVDPRETSVSLGNKLSRIGASHLVRFLKDVKNLRNIPYETPQCESRATYCGKLTKEMGRVNVETMTAVEIDRCARALVPWPGVTTCIFNKEVKLVETSLVREQSSIEIQCAKGTLLFARRIQSPGRSIVYGDDWLRGIK